MNYWVIIDNQKVGPMSLMELRRIPLTPDSMVWHTGMADWRKAASFPELAPLFGPAPAPQPNPTQAAPDYAQPADRPQPYCDPFASPAQQQQQAGYYRPQQPVRPPMPETYLGWNIAAIILCCCIPAIVGVIYSSKVSSRYMRGDYDGARSASSAACGWLIASIVLWVVLQLPLMLFYNVINIATAAL